MADGVIVFDADGRVEYVNAQAERMSGYSAEDLLGQIAEMLVPPRYRAEHEAHRDRYVRSPTARPMGAHLDTRLTRRDGRELPVDMALSPLETEAGLQV